MAAPRILLVSYNYPPWGGSGVQRPAALARCWARAGADVHVLTANHRHYPLIDRSLDDGTQAGVTIHRVSGFDPGGIATRLIPFSSTQRDGTGFRMQQRVYWRAQRFADQYADLGGESWWVSAAIRAAGRIIKRFNIDVVVTTSPPHAVQLVGAALQEKTGLPWIADLRDPVVDNFAFAPANDRIRDRWVQLEIKTVTKADQVVVSCDDYATHLAQKYRLAQPKLTCITNGYHHSARTSNVTNRPDHEAFTMAHVGAFYHAQSPQSLLQACRSLRQKNESFRRCFRLRLVGSIAKHLEDVFHADDDTFVDQTGYVDRADAATAMQTADALFFMTPAHPNGRYCYPGKIFEYLATDRPILALVHHGASIETLLRNAGGVTIAHHGEPDSLEDAMHMVFNRWQTSSVDANRDAAFVDQFAQTNLANRYLALINETIGACKLDTANDDAASAIMPVGG